MNSKEKAQELKELYPLNTCIDIASTMILYNMGIGNPILISYWDEVKYHLSSKLNQTNENHKS